MNCESDRERHLKLLNSALKAVNGVLEPNQDVHVDVGTVVNLTGEPITMDTGSQLVTEFMQLIDQDV